MAMLPAHSSPPHLGHSIGLPGAELIVVERELIALLSAVHKTTNPLDVLWSLSTVLHNCTLSTWEKEGGSPKFKDSLNYIIRGRKKERIEGSRGGGSEKRS